MWLFSSRFESSKGMIVAHVSISDPQACSPAEGKGHQYTKETQKISPAQLKAHKANPSTSKGRPYDARVMILRSPTPSPKHPSCPPCTSTQVHVPNFGGFSGSEDRGGADNSIQFINFGRVGDKSFEKLTTKNRGVEGWVTTILTFSSCCTR